MQQQNEDYHKLEQQLAGARSEQQRAISEMQKF